MFLLLRSSAGAGSGGFPLSEVLGELAAALNAKNLVELVFWSEADLYEFGDEAAKRLARATGVFVERDTSLAVIVSTSVYTLPARHLSTISVAIGNRHLQPASVIEIEALDQAWPDTSKVDPSHWLGDGQGTEQLRLYPTPAAGAAGAIAVVFHQIPATVSAGSPTIAAPSCLREYFRFSVLAAARGFESKAAMPEVSEACLQIAGLIEEVCRSYWGGCL